MDTDLSLATDPPIEIPKPALAAPSRSTAWFVCALFVLSGACALAYEVVWTRFLGLFLGHTVLLHMAVLGAFMGGLALGSFLIGSRADSARQPLKLYGWLELCIACFGLAFPYLAKLAEQLTLSAAASLVPGSVALLALKIGCAVLLLIVPTTLMGATFPALTAHLNQRLGAGASGANWLYFANCAGAVIGVLVTGFWLVPNLGLSGTCFAVAILNVLIAGVAIAASGPEAGRGAAAAPEAAVRPNAQVARVPRGVLAAICLSGATAFIYELVWTRMFAVTLGGSTYSFTLMLAAFITGLALGSIAAGCLPGVRRSPLAWFAGAEVLIGLAIAISIPLYERLPYWFWHFKWLLRPEPESMPLYLFFQYALTFLVMAVPTFLFGLTFPLAIRAAAGDRDEVAAEAAAVYGWNTVGTLAGVVAAGVFLIPVLGLRGALVTGAVLNLAVGGFLALTGGIKGRPRHIFGACAVAALALLFFGPRWHPFSFTFGAFRSQHRPPSSWSAYAGKTLYQKAVFYKEDFGTTVAVFEAKDPNGGRDLRLFVDGKVDASAYGDLTTQVLLGQIPLLLKPDARDVFLIGLGSGVTAGSILTHPVERVECAELSRAVAAASEHFAEFNGRPGADPRFRMTIDDGKTALAATPRKYDVIVSEPTNPWISGVGNLFSEEFFRSAAGKLKPGGIITQWFHSYEFDDALVATTIRTFRSVFPHVLLFQTHSRDHVLVGSLQPFAIDFAAMEERLKRPEVGRDLARVRVGRLATLLACQTHTGEAIARLEEGGGINSDDLPLLEYLAPRALYTSAVADKIINTDARLTRDPDLLLNRYLALRPPEQADYAGVLDLVSDSRTGNTYLEFRLLREYLAKWPNDTRYLRQLALFYDSRNMPEEGLPYAAKAAALGDAEAGKLAKTMREKVASIAGPLLALPDK